MKKMPRSGVAREGFFAQSIVMKIVPFESEKEPVPAPLPEVSAELYAHLFRAADWAVTSPWTVHESQALFEFSDENGAEQWQALSQVEAGVSLLVLLRLSGQGRSDRLEIQFMGSDFLQGHDYELNVRYAPDSWDACEKDVIVLRARQNSRPAVHPGDSEVKLLSEALRLWQERGKN